MSALNVKIDKFTGRNSFSLWQIKMRALLKQQGLWMPLSKEVKADNAELAALEEKAHSTIMLCLADDVITEVADEETAAGLWLKLESLYMTKSLTNKLLLKQRLFGLRMQEGTPLRDHLDQLNTILLELRNIDVKVEDEDAALILLVSLPLSYENFVQSFVVGKDTVSLEEVRSSLHTRELRHKATGAGTDNQAAGLIASGSKGHGQLGKKKPGSKGPKATDICNYCKETGHWKNECPKKRKQPLEQKGSAAVAVDGTDSEEDIALVADEHTHHADVWVLDSGASYHICPRREWFSTYEQIDGRNVSMANSSVCKAVGIGSIKIRTHDGKLCTLHNVRHVPLMTKNMISLSLLDSKGFSFKGEGGVIHVYRGSNVILKGVKQGTLYFLQGSTVAGSAVVASSEVHRDDLTKLWHMRLGHMGERGLQILSKEDLLGGKKIKRLRTDNGLKFCSSEFDVFCKDERIARHRTVRDTPQQNGAAERMNQTLLERARCMLSNAGLTRRFWAEAVTTACYITNQGPYTGINCKTPFKVWTGKPADYSNLRVFGCTAYYHVNEGKLEPRAKKGIFVGYGEGVKKVGTADNPADMFTKPVPQSKFQHCLDLLNITSC